MAADDEFLLKWHDHHQSFFLLVEELVVREQLTDVTLACGDGESQQLLPAHSLMLSVCSPYFRSLLGEAKHREKHHIIHLHGVQARLMQQLLLYMYRGEISISQEDLGPLIETARCLQIKGLSMASPALPPLSSSPRKRPHSVLGEGTPSPGEGRGGSGKKGRKRQLSSSSPSSPPAPMVVEDEGEGDMVGDLCLSSPPAHPPSLIQGVVALPILPKPLEKLKTAETRTHLSKLIWIGNGGRRPQYGNPETKPCWWPQHILPWEEMKKMGGRKSVELSHINYTEILKQCLAAGYEYFGYDPLTYYSTEVGDEEEKGLLGVGEEEGRGGKEEQVLEIDLDQVESYRDDEMGERSQELLSCK